ncbi:MAG: hypothetical protein M1455_06460 [Actinobacteria bacterium]|nr:hypothetical protein [Actinomycetota bacterium]
MPDVSIKFRKGGVRGATSPGECINLASPLNPGGHRGLKFTTNRQGGDGSIEFSIADRGPDGNWPARKNDAAEVYYGLERVTQHAISSVKRNEMEGALSFLGQGHDPHYEKRQNIWLSSINPGWDVWGWIYYATIAGAGSWVGLGLPWINNSQRYCQAMQAAENPVVDRKQDVSETYEKIIGDCLAYCDFERGIFPGRESDPNALGCYFYWRHRTRGKTVKWYVEKEDMASISGGGFRIELDWSRYQNWVAVHYKDTTGADAVVTRADNASLAKYGMERGDVLDLRSSNLKLTVAQAQQVGDTYLSIYTQPIPRGSIVLPLQNVRSTSGMRWAGLIRAGDVVKVERDEYRAFDESNPIDNFNGFLIEETIVDYEAGTVELKTSDQPDDMESLLRRIL